MIGVAEPLPLLTGAAVCSLVRHVAREAFWPASVVFIAVSPVLAAVHGS